MVMGPAPPKGSIVDSGGRTIVPSRQFQGPVRPGTDVREFRSTGISKSSRGRGSGGSFERVSKEETAKKESQKLAAAQAAASKKLAQAKLIQEMRKKGRAEATKRTQQALRGQRTASQQAASDKFQEKLQRQLTERESERIRIERARIKSAGGRVETKTLKSAETGEDVIITTTRGEKGTRIFEVEDTKTGKKTIRTFEKGKGQTGGLVFSGAPTVDTVEIKPEVTEFKALSVGDTTGDKKGVIETTTTSLISPFLALREAETRLRESKTDLTPTIPGLEVLTTGFILPSQEAKRVFSIFDTGVQSIAEQIPSGVQSVLTSTQLGRDVIKQKARRNIGLIDTGVNVVSSELAGPVSSGFESILTSTQLGKDVVVKEASRNLNLFDTGVQSIAEQIPSGVQSVLTSTQLGKDVATKEAQKFTIFDTGVQTVSRRVAEQVPSISQSILTSTQLGKDIATKEAQKFSVFDTGVQAVSREISRPDLTPAIPGTEFLKSQFIIPTKESRRTVNIFDTGVQTLAGQIPAQISSGFTGAVISTRLGKEAITKEAKKFSIFEERADTFLTGDIVIPKTLPEISVAQIDGSLVPVTKDVELKTTRAIKSVV